MSGETIPYVTLILQGTILGTSSTATGYFVIPSIPPGTYMLSVSHVGFHRLERSVSVRPNTTTDVAVQLVPTVIESEGATVYGQQEIRPHEADLGLERLSVRDIAIVPKGVEMDIFRVLQFLPGVSTTSDVSSRYYVRGGGSDQNVVLLNGATIYNPFHTLGIFSVIDPELISALEFHKGGFPPEYGNRLSSVLTVVSRDGNQNEYHGSVQAGLLSGKLSVEGPIPDGSFLFTGRRSWYASVMRKYLPQNQAPFEFYDGFGKITYQSPLIDENSRFSLFGFTSSDDVRHDTPLRADYSVANHIGGLNWHKVWSAPLYSTLTVAYSGFEAELFPKLSSSFPKRNIISDMTVNWDFSYVYDSRDEVAFGVHSKFLRTTLDQVNSYGNRFIFRQSGSDLSVYLNYKYYRLKTLGATVGLRIKLVPLGENRPPLFEPRINMTWRPGPLIAVKGAFGFYTQEVATLAQENELLTVFEPWFIMPAEVRSPVAAHASVGVKGYITDRFTLELEGYYKPITYLIDINERRYYPWQRDFTNVDGKAYGVELMSVYEPGWMKLQTTYSLGWVRKVKEAVWFYPRYDTRHSLSVLCGITVGTGWEVSASWSLRSGMPFTPIAGFYDRLVFGDASPWYGPDAFQASALWGARNSKRLPYYHRLDLGLSKTFRWDPIELGIELGILNVYNRKNIFYFDGDTGEEFYMLPFFPTLSVRVGI